ncbi:hypothetical protein Rsub_11004 [Raphidocelis subcapitata]|uniref:Uncharacterized protein n=1 Tax=Raphidocelis subcapitata TaxID=307507 RepID=A0A2V0PJ63_9CHLO|nr:hypothetical protein Rsub_11004 [Raphidocelis subcapitata]|eukprot:GBF97357.1 hypothetical protein Rsub_11004 [Raphidocelis subcapitata]
MLARRAASSAQAAGCVPLHSRLAGAVGAAIVATAAAAAPPCCWADAAAPPPPAQAASRLAQVAAVVQRDFVEGQYYVRGTTLTPSIYEPDAVFKDPTTNVAGVEKYTTAVAALFDPASSRADLISIDANTGSNTIRLRWRLEGKLKLLGGLPIKPYTGTTTYYLDDAGLISRHEEVWDITALDAFASTFFPGFGAPPAPPAEQLRARAE